MKRKIEEVSMRRPVCFIYSYLRKNPTKLIEQYNKCDNNKCRKEMLEKIKIHLSYDSLRIEKIFRRSQC